MDIHFELVIVVKAVAAIIAGGIIGFDRERQGLDAGMRTYAAVCLGATLFTAIGELLHNTDAISRIIANIIVGIGFLGAGTIFKDQSENRTLGLTTAATIWGTAAVGITIGLDLYIISAIATFSLFMLLALPTFKWYRKWTNSLKKPEK